MAEPAIQRTATNYSGRKLAITVLLENMVFEGRERLDAIAQVTKTKDRLIDMAQRKKGGAKFDDEARKKYVVSSTIALMKELESGSTRFSDAEMQNALIENLLYLLGKLPTGSLRGIHGVIVVPQKDGRVEFTPYETRAEYEDTVARLRAAFGQGGEAPVKA